MSFGQSFQERNASFEHMYSPNKAKVLFKNHRDIAERQEREAVRMAWEHKTTVNELSKDKILIQRRRDILYAKQRAMEEQYFKRLTQAEESRDDEYEYEKAKVVRPATHTGIRGNKKRLHSALASAIKPRPATAFVSVEAIGKGSRPSSGKIPATPMRQTASAVHFAMDNNNEDNKENVTRASTPQMEKPPYLSRKSAIMGRRSRRKSVFALTKAKQFELRNQGYKEDNQIFQDELKERIDVFFLNLDHYKEEYRRSLEPRSTDLPEITDKDITNTADITIHNNMSNKFKLTTVNPFQKAILKVAKEQKQSDSNTDEKNQLKSNCKKKPTKNSLKSPSCNVLSHPESNRLSEKSSPSYIHTADNLENSQTSLQQEGSSKSNLLSRPSMTTSLRPRTTSQLSSVSAVFLPDNQPISCTNDRVRKTLSISQRPNLTGDDMSREQMMRERVKLLYLDAHGKLKAPPEEKPKPKPKLNARSSELRSIRVDLQLIRDAFDEYVETDQTPDDMMRLVSTAMKLKHEARKKRDKSFVPFLSVLKYAKQWKKLTSSHHPPPESQSQPHTQEDSKMEADNT